MCHLRRQRIDYLKPWNQSLYQTTACVMCDRQVRRNHNFVTGRLLYYQYMYVWYKVEVLGFSGFCLSQMIGNDSCRQLLLSILGYLSNFCWTWEAKKLNASLLHISSVQLIFLIRILLKICTVFVTRKIDDHKIKKTSGNKTSWLKLVV